MNNVDMIRVRGFLHSLIYKDDVTGYAVITLRLDGCNLPDEYNIRRDGVLKCCGYDLPHTRAIPFIMDGYITKKPNGMIYTVVKGRPDDSTKEVEMVSYLASMEGIGTVTAKRILDEFGDESLSVIREEPEKLIRVKGVSQRIIERLKENSLLSKSTTEVLKLIMGVGGTPNVARRIALHFGSATPVIVKQTPYKLLEMSGFTFPVVDSIALGCGIKPDSKERIIAAINYSLERCESSGSTCIKRDVLVKEITRTLANPPLSAELISKVSDEMVSTKKVRLIKHPDSKEVLIQRNKTYDTEAEIGKKMALIASYERLMPNKLDSLIEIAEEKYGITLSDEQRHAVKRAVECNAIIITGGPGRGKTAVEKIICEVLEIVSPSSEIVLMAPTGKAARQMTDSTGRNASTVDSRLKMHLDSEKVRFDNAILIVDEVSMVDIWHMEYLMDAIGDDCRLILIGDEDQLPSVGCGNVLHDLIKSHCVPVVRLTKNYRQGDGSVIGENADLINAGDLKLRINKKFRVDMRDKYSQEEMADILAKTFLEKVSIYGLENAKCLVPMHKGPCGTLMMNARLQEVLNPKGNGKPEMKVGQQTFRVGDPVLHTKNDKSLGVVNGDVGYVIDIPGDGSMVCDYYGTEVKYQGEALYDVVLNYAMTIHKSQGSEYKAVVTCLHRDHLKLLVRNLIYTDITRAKEDVTIFAETVALRDSIKNPAISDRKSMLAVWISYYTKKIREYQEAENPFKEVS